jgi:polyhydroxybutyrate depolymerase
MRVVLAAVCVLGCGDNGHGPVDAAVDAAVDTAVDAPPDTGCPSFDTGPIGGSRPLSVHVPPSYDPCHPAPLVVMLHGYAADGAVEELYLALTAQADARGLLYAYPDGTLDVGGNRFWNATDACCNFYGSTVDDSTYLHDLIAEIGRHYNVDAKRVFLVGHANGGFMAYRMACDHADQIAAIASLSGAMYMDVARCQPTTSVAVLHIHGTADSSIPYNGSAMIPAATTTVGDWVTFDGCSSTADTSAPPLDLDSTIAGAETTITRYASGCRGAELWTIAGGTGVPSLTASFQPAVIDFLLAHGKP